MPSRRSLKDGKREEFKFETLVDPFEASRGNNEGQESSDNTPQEISSQEGLKKPPGAIAMPGLGPNPGLKRPPGAVALPGIGTGKKPPPGAVGMPGLGGFNPADIKSQLKKTNAPVANNNPESSLNLPKKTLVRASTTNSISSDYQKGRDELFKWCKNCTEPYGIPMQNFTTSWSDGMAFCALIHHNRPGMIDFNSLKKENKNENLKIAL